MMAVGAFFGDVGMFVNEWPLVFHVASGTKSLGSDAFETASIHGKMRIVAVGAGHLVFRNRVMGELGKFGLNLLMTAGTEHFLFMTADFLLWPLMQLVAIQATDIVQGVYT